MTEFQYSDPYLKAVERQRNQDVATKNQHDRNTGFVGDLVDVAQQGGEQSFAGDAEAVGQIFNSDTFKNIGQSLAKNANQQTDGMTDESRQALSERLFKEDPDNMTGVSFDDGATNWRTWALQFGALGGQVAANAATGFGIGSLAKVAIKKALSLGAGKLISTAASDVAGKGVLSGLTKAGLEKEAQQLVAKSAVKEAIRNGALNDVRSALIAAPTKEAMQTVLNHVTTRINGIAMTAAASSMAAGMRAQQARDDFMSLDQDTLNSHPEFQKAYWDIADSPENQGLDATTIYGAAKELLAEKAATTAFYDKKALLSDVATGLYVPGVGGVLGRGAANASKLARFGKGVAIEGSTEAWQGGETQRAVNEAIKEWGDESRDPLAGVISTRYEEGVLGGLFGGGAKVLEGQHHAPTKPIISIEGSANTGNPVLDNALAQTDSNEQSRYNDLTDHVDTITKPAYMRNGEISPGLESAIAQFRMDELTRQQEQLRTDGIMRPLDNPVVGNPDEPAFLRSQSFNPTGRDLSAAAEVDPSTAVQQALAGSRAFDPVELLNQAKAAGNVGPTPMDEFSGELLPKNEHSQSLVPASENDSVTVDGQSSEVIPESLGIGYNNTINMPGEQGNGVNDNYVPPVTADRVAPDRSLDVESTRDPRSPVAQAIDNAGSKTDAIFGQLQSVRVTKRGKPFASQKEAQLASRKTETPIELPTGGFGVVDKVELEQAKSNINQPDEFQQYVNDHGFQPVDDVNDMNAADIKQTTDNVDVNQSSNSQASETHGGDLRGPDINDEWVSFSDKSDSLKIPRSEMPQIKTADRGAMVNFLNARGISHHEETIPATELKPTQAEFSPGKVESAKQADSDRAILVSSDGYVVDGHHQWIAKRDKGGDVRAIRLNSPAKELIPLLHEFPSSNVDPTSEKPEEMVGESNKTADQEVGAQSPEAVTDPVVKMDAQSVVTPNSATDLENEAQNLNSVDAINPEKTGADIAPFEFEDKPDGTMLIKGDTNKLKALAKENGITAASHKHGIIVGKNSVTKAKEIINSGNGGTEQNENYGRDEPTITDAASNKETANKSGFSLSEQQKAEQPENQQVNKITDFGEKIGGAKKDIWQTLKDSMNGETAEDIKSLPLSKAWPEPNYQQLIDNKMNPFAVAFIRAARESIPTKPKLPSKVSTWSNQVKALRDISISLADETINPDSLKEKMLSSGGRMRYLNDIMGKADLYHSVGHAKSLADLTLTSGHYSVFNGEKYNPSKVIWSVNRKSKSTAFGNWPHMVTHADTKEQAISQFKAMYDSLPENSEATKRTATFDIFSNRDGSGFYIGKKIGRNPTLLEGPFKEIKDARKFKDEHIDELTAKLEKVKEIPRERRDINNPRVGEDMRGGRDVTPEMFTEAFGFRGVEFGNWVENDRRQRDLNDAYDALMDMAAVIGIPPKAVSLNGELGIAFGARGSGGKNPAAAHYEPGHIVINLTKKNGAGSLGHEWWHALDDYFARMRKTGDGNMTESRMVNLSANGSNYFHSGDVRKEMVDAFGAVIRGINNTALKARSSKLDAKRTKEYWTTNTEMSARAFESYLISKLQDQNASNDYLSNIVAPETWEAAEKLGFELDSSFPYPTAGEIPTIRGAFDKFFSTIDHKKENENIALFSKSSFESTNTEKSGKGMTKPEAAMVAKEWLRQFKTDINVEVVKDQAEFESALADRGFANSIQSGEMDNAAYLPDSKTILINASAIQNPKRLKQIMRHEILVHHGLRYVVGEDAYVKIMNAIARGYETSPAIRDAVDTVTKNYADKDMFTQMEEAFAHYAENRPADSGPVGRLWQRIVSMVKSALQKVGFLGVNESEQQLDSVLNAIAKNMRNGIEDGVMAEHSDDVMLSRSSTADDELMTKLGLGPKQDVIDKTRDRITNLKKADRAQVKSWIDETIKKANTQILDALAPIKYAEDANGKVDASDSGYVAARLASGSATVMNATMLHGLPAWKDGVIQRKAGTSEKDSLLGIFEGLGSDLHNWLAWMAGHRAEILKADGRENLLTDDDIKALIAKGNGKDTQFNEAKKKWNTLNSAVLDLAEEAGLFTAEDRSAWDSEWYVPFFRETEDGDVTGPYKHKGIANQTAGIKKLKGGTANVNDILQNIFTTTSKTIDAAMKNMAAQKVVHNLAETDLIEVITKPNLMDIKAAVKNQNDMMIVKLEGEDYLIRVNDKNLFNAMTMIDQKVERGAVRRLAMKAKHILTAGVTVSPDFMFRNFLRDAASTWAINEDGFKPIIDSFRGAIKSWNMDESSINMMFSGASFMGGNLRGNDPEAMASAVRKALRRKGMSPEQVDRYEKTIIRNGKQVMDAVGKYWEQYERVGEAVENGSREAVYEAAIKAGKTHAQAAFEAKDLMDFSMMGSSKLMQVFVDVLPFFNARMQGLGKLGRAIKANPKQIAKRGGMIAGASLALLALNWDNERYEDLPDWDKDLNWHFWLGDQHFRIPKPFEIGLMFGTLPERMVRTMGGKDTAGKFGKVVARNMLETFAINPIPQVVKPLTEAYFNYDPFRGGPIENMSDMNVNPEARYDERTSLMMRELGELTGMSPKKLEHVISGYTGTMGGYVMAMGDGMVRMMGDYGDSPALRADQIPILKSVYQGSAPAKSTQAMQDFYQMVDEANQVYATIKQYNKEGRIDDANSLLEENRDKLAGRKTLNKAQLQFRALRNEMSLIQRDRLLDSDQKRDRLDKLLKRRNDFAAQLIQRFE